MFAFLCLLTFCNHVYSCINILEERHEIKPLVKHKKLAKKRLKEPEIGLDSPLYFTYIQRLKKCPQNLGRPPLSPI